MRYSTIDVSDLLMEVVPATLVTVLCIAVTVTSLSGTERDQDKFVDWATNLIAMYVGKAIAEQTQERTNRNIGGRSEYYSTSPPQSRTTSPVYSGRAQGRGPIPPFPGTESTD